VPRDKEAIAILKQISAEEKELKKIVQDIDDILTDWYKFYLETLRYAET